MSNRLMSKEIEIIYMQGIEGNSLYINNYRFAGPKPWGGGKILKAWKVTQKDFLQSLKRIGISVKEDKE